MGIIQTVPCPSCRYSVAGQEYGPASFFLFSARPRLSFSRLSKGRKPHLSLRSRDNSVREPNAQPVPATGLFKGFGMLSQQAKTGFRRSRRKPVLSLCGNKDTACQVANHHKYLKQFGTENQCLEYLTAQRWKEEHGTGRTAILGVLTLSSAIRSWGVVHRWHPEKASSQAIYVGLRPVFKMLPCDNVSLRWRVSLEGQNFLVSQISGLTKPSFYPNSCLLTDNN